MEKAIAVAAGYVVVALAVKLAAPYFNVPIGITLTYYVHVAAAYLTAILVHRKPSLAGLLLAALFVAFEFTKLESPQPLWSLLEFAAAYGVSLPIVYLIKPWD